MPQAWRKWKSQNNKAAVILCNKNIEAATLKLGQHTAAIKARVNGKEVVIMSGYSSPKARKPLPRSER